MSCASDDPSVLKSLRMAFVFCGMNFYIHLNRTQAKAFDRKIFEKCREKRLMIYETTKKMTEDC